MYWDNFSLLINGHMEIWWSILPHCITGTKKYCPIYELMRPALYRSSISKIKFSLLENLDLGYFPLHLFIACWLSWRPFQYDVLAWVSEIFYNFGISNLVVLKLYLVWKWLYMTISVINNSSDIIFWRLWTLAMV